MDLLILQNHPTTSFDWYNCPKLSPRCGTLRRCSFANLLPSLSNRYSRCCSCYHYYYFHSNNDYDRCYFYCIGVERSSSSAVHHQGKREDRLIWQDKELLRRLSIYLGLIAVRSSYTLQCKWWM